jgi:hypothetical protein
MRKTLSGGFLARPFGKLGLRSGAKVVILARHRDGWQLPGLPPTVIAFQEKKKGKMKITITHSKNTLVSYLYRHVSLLPRAGTFRPYNFWKGNHLSRKRLGC